MDTNLELLVTDGPLKDRRFGVSSSGVRLGRSSSCEISIPDPALSRNHCLFELRDGSVWLTDLASANGTLVNDVSLGADSRALAIGDRVQVGDTTLAVVAVGASAPEPIADSAPAVAGSSIPAAPKIDLGFRSCVDGENPLGRRSSVRRLALWVVAAVAVLGTATVILFGDASSASPEPIQSIEQPEPGTGGLCAFTFEKVEADANVIYRYALSYDGGGRMSVEIDDVPKENRHVRKTVQLRDAAQRHLEELLAAATLQKFEPEYVGTPLRPGTLRSFALRVVRDARVYDVSVENAQEPDAFRELREKLETFSKNELGIWAIQYSAEKLLEMSAEARRAGDAKWSERDVRHGNLAMALQSYCEAMFYLETVDPKPADYSDLVNRRLKAEKELDKRYRDQRFLADRAINLADWDTALRELRVLCELVPDARDPRHSEASAKLLDVEARIKKGGRK